MKEQLVSFKTAKLAKEKGFDEKCVFGYTYEFPDKKVKDLSNGFGNDSMVKNSDFEESIMEIEEEPNIEIFVYTAPTQSLLQKWLRDEHNIHIEISLNDCGGTTKYDVALYWINPEAMWTKINCRNFNTHEEALEVGLYEALKLIKNKIK